MVGRGAVRAHVLIEFPLQRGMVQIQPRIEREQRGHLEPPDVCALVRSEETRRLHASTGLYGRV
jgi:hypothetical protein